MHEHEVCWILRTRSCELALQADSCSQRLDDRRSYQPRIDFADIDIDINNIDIDLIE